jgi:hypothetical protein
MTLGDLLEALDARGSVVYLDGGALRHRGPRLAPSDPIQVAWATFHDEVTWLVASGHLCVFCPRRTVPSTCRSATAPSTSSSGRMAIGHLNFDRQFARQERGQGHRILGTY